MDANVMDQLCPANRVVGTGSLADHRLAFTRRSIKTNTGVADIVPTAGAVVWGVVYNLAEADLETLDHKEGQGWAYERTEVVVCLAADGSQRRALTYKVLQPACAEVSPSPQYLELLVGAARARQLPRTYVRWLAARRGGEA